MSEMKIWAKLISTKRTNRLLVHFVFSWPDRGQVKADSRKTQGSDRPLSRRQQRRAPPAWLSERPPRSRTSSGASAGGAVRCLGRGRVPTAGRASIGHGGETSPRTGALRRGSAE